MTHAPAPSHSSTAPMSGPPPPPVAPAQPQPAVSQQQDMIHLLFPAHTDLILAMEVMLKAMTTITDESPQLEEKIYAVHDAMRLFITRSQRMCQTHSSRQTPEQPQARAAHEMNVQQFLLQRQSVLVGAIDHMLIEMDTHHFQGLEPLIPEVLAVLDAIARYNRLLRL